VRKPRPARPPQGLRAPKALVRDLEPAPGIEVERLGDEGVLYAHAEQQILGLNAPAAFVWYGIERGLSAERVTATFAKRFQVSPAEAALRVSSLLREWIGRGWLLPAPPAPRRRFARSGRYRLLGTTFRLRCATRAQHSLVHPALAHLEVADGTAPDVALDLLADGTGHAVLEDGRETDRCASLEALTPLVKASFWRLAVNRRRYFLQIHAAVLMRAGRCVLLPAEAGSGKSTLAAGLAATGFRYLSDEAALLELPSLRVRPVPLALTVKPGSVPLLEPWYPGLGALPAHRREDGKTVRYLEPPRRARLRDPDRSYPVAALVFPRVAPRTRLRALPRAEALRRLLAQCLVLPEDLDAERVRLLVAWLRGLRCFELESGPLPQAMAAVRRALG